jgi:thiol-disulfide isomerase/thioredoxin
MPETKNNVQLRSPVESSALTPAVNFPGVISAHPDAVRRREQALARKASAQVEAERAQSREWWEGRTPANLMSAATPEAFEAAISTGGLVVVDFFTPWCNACRRLFPALCKVAENNPDVLFLKVNGGDSALGKFVESLAVDKLPYFHFYRDGSLQAHFAANLTKINLLRAEIAALKECKEASCLLPEC